MPRNTHLRSTTRLTWSTYQWTSLSKPLLNFSRPASSACATFGALRPTQVSSTPACVRLRRLAAMAGLKVKAIKTDNAIAETMVAENWR